MKNQGTIANIQALRAFSASIVVLSHAVTACEGYGFGNDIFATGSWGWQGVDIFFIISCFVMVLTQHRKNRSIGAFILDRVIRIVPLYWLLTIALFVLLLVAGRMFRELTADTSVFLQSLTFTALYMARPGDLGVPLIFVGWTLEYEMFFYLIFALCLALPRWRDRIVVQALVLLAMVLFTPMKAFCFEFLMGELLALFYIFGKSAIGRREGAALCLFGLLLLIGTLPFGSKVQPMLWGYRLVAFGVPALLAVAGAIYAKQVRLPVLKLLGDASYSIYLLQVFAIPLVFKIAVIVVPHMTGYIVTPFAIVVSIAAGVGLYLIVEKPMTDLLKRRAADLPWMRAHA